MLINEYLVESMNSTRHRCRNYYSGDCLLLWLLTTTLFITNPVSSWTTSSHNKYHVMIADNSMMYHHRHLHELRRTLDSRIYGIPPHETATPLEEYHNHNIDIARIHQHDKSRLSEINPKNVAPQPRRRHLLQLGSTTLVSVLTSMQFVPPCTAGEIGRRITEAVTTSELGVTVRRSVVRGAQMMDALDLRAEKFSDTYQLGSERSKQSKRPLPKVIPPLQPFDTTTAWNILQRIDEVFCSITNIPINTLQQRVRLVTNKVQPSFERSGVELLSLSSKEKPESGTDDSTIPPKINIQNGPQFNFLMYVHYKSYTELWLEKFATKSSNQSKDFAPFQKQFEKQIGEDLLSLFLESPTTSFLSASLASSNTTASNTGTAQRNDDDRKHQNDQERAFYNAVKRIDDLSKVLVAKGFVAQIDRTPFDDDTNSNTDATLSMDVTDWSQQLISDLSWSIALDNDITLSSQILLQEQGIRFYPNYIRCMVQSILQQALERPYQQKIVTEDYYLDTDYNSDPDKFEVKEVLININIENVL